MDADRVMTTAEAKEFVDSLRDPAAAWLLRLGQAIGMIGPIPRTDSSTGAQLNILNAVAVDLGLDKAAALIRPLLQDRLKGDGTFIPD